MRRQSLLACLCVALAGPVAADRAVLAGVTPPAERFWSGPSLSAAEILRQGRFDVRGSDGGIEAVRADLRAILDGLEEEDRLVIHLEGQFLRAGDLGWYMGTRGASADLLSVGAQGLSLDVVLAIAGRVPGGAFVLLGQRQGGPAPGGGLRAGFPVLQVPQGVTVITGPADSVARAARDSLYRPGGDVRAALADAPDLRVLGFAPRGHAILRQGGGAPDPAPGRVPVGEREEERAFWASVRAENSESAYRDYLQRYPRGAFRAQAQQGLDALLNDPVRRAEAAEAALTLSRDDRRQVQTDLTVLGFDTRGIDGIFGPGTRSALRDWQAGQGMAITGFLDATQIALLARQGREARADREARAREEDRLWQEIGGADGMPADLRRYLERYPQGRNAPAAREVLALVEEVRRTPADRRDQSAWIDARRGDSVQAYRRYLEDWPAGYFAADARARLEAMGAGDRAAQEGAARAEEAALNLNPLTRLLVEQRLARLGLPVGTVDGAFTAETREALRLYQQDRGLPVHGYLTEVTVTRMLAEIGITFSRD